MEFPHPRTSALPPSKSSLARSCIRFPCGRYRRDPPAGIGLPRVPPALPPRWSFAIRPARSAATRRHWPFASGIHYRPKGKPQRGKTSGYDAQITSGTKRVCALVRFLGVSWPAQYCGSRRETRTIVISLIGNLLTIQGRDAERYPYAPPLSREPSAIEIAGLGSILPFRIVYIRPSEESPNILRT